MESSLSQSASCTGETVSSDSAPSTSAAPPPGLLLDRDGREVPPLRTYYLYLTAGCNLACRHCWVSPRYQPNGGTGGHLELAMLDQALDEAIPLGLVSCKLTGGEPTLHPDFIALCERIHRRGLDFWMESNGLLIGAAEARHLARLGMRFCSISLDGATAETHDHQRAVPGAFEGALAGIARLVEVGIRPQVILTLTRKNVHELEPLFELAASLGCASVKINLLEPTGRGQLLTVDDHGLSSRELLTLGERITALERSSSIRLHYSWPPAFWSLARIVSGESASTCGVHNILGLLADGTLAMCGIGRQEPELVYGRIGETPVADVWLSHLGLRALRDIRPADLEGVCGQCLHASTCFGACRANTYTAARSLRAPYRLCQDAYEMGLFPASRLRPGPLQVESAASPALTPAGV